MSLLPEVRSEHVRTLFDISQFQSLILRISIRESLLIAEAPPGVIILHSLSLITYSLQEPSSTRRSSPVSGGSTLTATQRRASTVSTMICTRSRALQPQLILLLAEDSLDLPPQVLVEDSLGHPHLVLVLAEDSLDLPHLVLV